MIGEIKALIDAVQKLITTSRDQAQLIALRTVFSDLTKLERQYEALGPQLEETQIERDQLRTDLGATSKANEGLQRQVAELQAQLAEHGDNAQDQMTRLEPEAEQVLIAIARVEYANLEMLAHNLGKSTQYAAAVVDDLLDAKLVDALLSMIAPAKYVITKGAPISPSARTSWVTASRRLVHQLNERSPTDVR